MKAQVSHSKFPGTLSRHFIFIRYLELSKSASENGMHFSQYSAKNVVKCDIFLKFGMRIAYIKSYIKYTMFFSQTFRLNIRFVEQKTQNFKKFCLKFYKFCHYTYFDFLCASCSQTCFFFTNYPT